MAAKKVSLRDLRQHIQALDKLVTEAWLNGVQPAEIDFPEVRKLAAAITALVAEDDSPHAATPTKPPKAADTEKSTAKERAAYQRAAADAPAFDASILGLSHIRKGGRP